jgi:hypothetical protein
MKKLKMSRRLIPIMVLYFRGCQKVIASVNSGIDEGSLGL